MEADILEEQMMRSVARRAIDDRVVGNVFSIMDSNGPKVDKDEGADKDELVHGKEKRVQVVRCRLDEAVEGVECVAGVRAGHDPFVMTLVQVLVDQGGVQPSVCPVNAEVGEHDEEEYLSIVVP